MEQLELLWQYQQEDMKADRLDLNIRRSPTRQTLEKSRAFILEQQKLYKQIEEQVAAMADRMDIIQDVLPRCEEQLKALEEKAASNPPETLEEVRALMAELSKVRDTIASYESEMKRMVKDSSDSVSKQKTIRHEAATAKQEFDSLKVTYDQELKVQKAERDAQRAVADAKMAGIEKRLLDEYNAIKKHITPPMARLLNDQCGGCNTSLPSAVLRKIKGGTDVVECETCGRMIIP